MTDPTPAPEPGRRAAPATPRWVKVSVIIVIVLIVLFAILQIASGGEHGPGQHNPTGAAPSIHAPLYSVLELSSQQL
jgi:hypothetical protein